ncbi:fatty acid cis/trans isomerase [Paraglaciecola sp.]|uniref:fatty acid cis/trans isomerase n=1 Tax=Paraglaciecola sp. TaxID=1920173 RepID=UPI00273E31BB|nr:fatty acid cis/trans isomerase [Paraglaciecola sp.]MDP5030714.1 fatty acid cis/trans isomerase [Paraglaciecola sp.]
MLVKPRWINLVIVVAILCVGCAAIARFDLNRLYGEAKPSNREVNLSEPLPELKFDEVNAVIESRCVVCHACYDAPCQLKMTSTHGIERGANKDKVYQGSRLLAAQPNRLFVDAIETQEWRERGFFPVLNERQQSVEANTQASLLARMLMLKQHHPLPASKLLNEQFDVSLNRTQECPTIEEFERYENNQPLAGMPYGLPGINAKEHNVLINWIKNGANMPADFTVSTEQQLEIDKLEAFLNADNLKMRLSSRYIYEHLFTSHLYFSEHLEPNTHAQFYNLVRSSSAPGTPIKVIATRRPFDDPQVERVYYRLLPVRSTIVNKTHQPYAIHEELMSKWQRWFVDAAYQVESLPSYEPEVAANPLTAFTQLPVNARYRFMLERAENTIMGYIKGPVCRGQVALNVINDHFWVYFLKPELADSPDVEAFYLAQKDNLRLPAEHESTAFALNWIEYAERQGQYLKARHAFLNKTLQGGQHLQLDGLWDGEGENTNASLTVFRHFDNATVVKGLVGEPPKTAWIIDYALLERIHYLLVAGFDVYGNYGHQLLTRLYMDFLRMEGESNFLALLPLETRRTEGRSWYQKSGQELQDFMNDYAFSFEQPSGITFTSDKPKAELFEKLHQYLKNVQPKGYALADSELQQKSQDILAKLGTIKGQSASIFPEITMIMVETEGQQDEIFTLIRNSAHFNVNSLFDEEDNRDKQHDNMTLVHGLLGSYPDVFWQVKEAELSTLVAAATRVKTEKAYAALLDQFGVRRTQADFWRFSDRFNAAFRQHSPIEAGWLDYNRLENR